MIAAIAVAAAATAVTACSAAPAASVSDMAAAHSAADTRAADTRAVNTRAADTRAADTRAASTSPAVRRGLLREFLTVHNRGYFYTAYPPEARSVVRKFHFHATGRTFGYVDAARQPHTFPLFRLHLVGRQSYLVTADVSEKKSLLKSGKFTLDGVLGYIARRSGPGRIPIWRLDNGPHPLWRLATTAQERRLRRHGWHLDGLIGFMFSKR